MKATNSASRTALVLAASLFCGAPAAWAGGDYEQAKLAVGANARDLAVSQNVEAIMRGKEREVADRRRVAIGLAEKYLAENTPGPETPEVMFQLAELRWEQSKADFLEQMAAYNGAVEHCGKLKEAAEKAQADADAANAAEGGPTREGHADEGTKKSKGKKAAAPVDAEHTERCRIPQQPELDLTSSQTIYKKLIANYPSFRKIDTVVYLYGFSLRTQGKQEEALVQFRRILSDYPQSRFRPDAWMAVAEARFYNEGDYKKALDGYEEVLKFPDSPLYDLALFKTAWCWWKLGDSDKAARRFKEVLDLGAGQQVKAHQVTAEGRKRLDELKGEALEYLVQVFTEDEKKGPKDAFDFLASIGGAIYSRKVIAKLAETFYVQARYSRAIESERFLINLDPADSECPDRQKRISDAYREMDDNKQAVIELRKLADDYSPDSTWAKAQQDPGVIDHAHTLAATALIGLAKNLHADAQHVELVQHHIDLDRYGRAAEAYGFYLSKFEKDKDAAEVSYLMGDIYYFKLKDYDKAGEAYLRVGQSKPVGKLHHEALLNAISAYEKERKAAPNGKILPSDKKMGEAIDLYATLYPNDPDIAQILIKNGELFFERGEYDEAVKRFGLIVERYPKNSAAGVAGDKILEALNKSKDYSNIESWARRLLKVPAFQSAADQERLGKLVIDSGMKAGEEKAESDPLEAAAIYLRVAHEFPRSARATQALTDAAVTFARGGKPEESVKVYGQLVDQYPQSSEAPAAAWSAGRLYEQAALWDQAATFYERLANNYSKDTHAADALFNAGLLREHLGQHPKAIAAYGEYARRYPKRDDVKEVAFRVGVVLDESGQRESAAKAFLEFAQKYPGGAKAIEALSRAGAALVEAGQDHRAAEPLAKAVTLYKKENVRDAAHSAAHARYLEGEALFHEFERAKLATDPKRLPKTLEEKSAWMDKAKSSYLDVVGFGDPEWATAGLYRIGDAYERFAKALRDTPVPAGLNAEEQQVYRDELEKYVVVVEDKALDAYKGGYKKALELGVYNEFTQKLRQALGRLDDQEYPKEAESRGRPQAADRHVTLPFYSSVQP